MTVKYFEMPCGFCNCDPDIRCQFCDDDNCLIDIEDPEEERPIDLRRKQMEEFEINEQYQELDLEEQEEIVAKMFPCYLHVTGDECIDAIQVYRKTQYGIKNNDNQKM